MTERAEGWHGVGNDNGVDSGCGVGNGVDTGRVNIVDVDREMLIQKPKQPEHYSTCKQNTKYQSHTTHQQ